MTSEATKGATGPPGMNRTCGTQLNADPSTGQPPAQQSSSGSHVSHKVVGFGPMYPRIGIQQKPLKMRWYTVESTFNSRDDAQYASLELKKAADEWNRIGLGVEFEPTNDESQAHFRLLYEKSTDETVYMKGFFPHQQATTDLRVLPITLTKRRAVMHNDFLHELGHILGLRHEFAVNTLNWFVERAADLATGGKALEFGTPNPKSVMSYADPATLQQTDMDNIKAFYKLSNGFRLGGDDGYRITDFPPVLRKKST